jgi:hypothetical protein
MIKIDKLSIGAEGFNFISKAKWASVTLVSLGILYSIIAMIHFRFIPLILLQYYLNKKEK